MKIEEIRNMKIEAGPHQWDGADNGLTAGSVTVTLSNGTKIKITDVVCTEHAYQSSEISIHRLRDTELSIFDRVTKKQVKYEGVFLASEIKTKKE